MIWGRVGPPGKLAPLDAGPRWWEELRHWSTRNLPESATTNKLRPIAFHKKDQAYRMEFVRQENPDKGGFPVENPALIN
jgi:hypothetical protein